MYEESIAKKNSCRCTSRDAAILCWLGITAIAGILLFWGLIGLIVPPLFSAIGFLFIILIVLIALSIGVGGWYDNSPSDAVVALMHFVTPFLLAFVVCIVGLGPLVIFCTGLILTSISLILYLYLRIHLKKKS